MISLSRFTLAALFLASACPALLAQEEKPAAATPNAFPNDKARQSYALGQLFAGRQKSQPGATGKTDVDQLIAGLKDALSGKVTGDYSTGVGIGGQLKRDDIEIDLDAMAAGLKDTLGAGPAKMTQQDVQMELNKLQQGLTEKQNKKKEAEGAGNLTEGEAFLAKNKSEKGVQSVTVAGNDGKSYEMQYTVLKPADGPKPTADDTVTCLYKGSLLDGTVFDETADGTGRSFGLRQVIKGWTEGIPLMNQGSKVKFWIPGPLAYGLNPRPGGPIKPNSLLVFEVELQKIEPKVAAAPAAPLTSGGAPREKAVATTPPIAIEMKDGKPVVKQVTPEEQAKAAAEAAKKAAEATK